MSAKLFRAAVVFCGLLLLWWLATRSGIPAFLLPSPRRWQALCGSTARTSANTR